MKYEQKNKSKQTLLMVTLWGMALLISLFAPAVRSEEVHYRYELKEGKGKAVCEHMTKVFNEKFKTPWYIDTQIRGQTSTVLGKPLDQTFARMKNVEYNESFTWNMLYSKYPSSAEFDAVKWKEGRYFNTGPFSRPKGSPMLVAEIDVDNDGKKEWLVKH